MGTNFYLVEDDNDDDEYAMHIGKRSAAGPYCWSCGVTLCKQGEWHVHRTQTWESYGTRSGPSQETGWFSVCPKCGAGPAQENDAAKLELGFRKAGTHSHQGVHSCCSFSWAMADFWKIEDENRYHVKDEYEVIYPLHEFRAMLKGECPIEYFDKLGVEFC